MVKKSKKVVYVLPYEFYFAGANNRTGGHIAHIIGVVEALVEKGYSVDVISDMRVPSLSSNHVSYYSPAFRGLRNLMRRRKDDNGTRKTARDTDSSSRLNFKRQQTRKFFYFIGRHIKNFLFLTGLFWTTWQSSRKFSVEFIYIRHNMNGFMPAIVAKITGIPLVVEVNTPCSMGSFTPEIQLKTQKNIVIKWRERMQYEFAHVISVVSPLVRDWIITHAGSKYAKKLLVNPNSVDVKRFCPEIDGAETRKRYGIQSDEILIGMAATFVWYHATDQLIEAFQRARRIAQNLRLILMGDSELLSELEKYVSDKKLSGSVVLTGMIPFEIMPSYLAACDILVSYLNFGDIPAWGSSIKHLEYLAMGCPVVATDIGYQSFGIRHGINGLLVPQGNIEAFAHALADLAADPAMRNRLGRQGRLDAEANHTWQANVERILSRL